MRVSPSWGRVNLGAVHNTSRERHLTQSVFWLNGHSCRGGPGSTSSRPERLNTTYYDNHDMSLDVLVRIPATLDEGVEIAAFGIRGHQAIVTRLWHVEILVYATMPKFDFER